MLDYFLIFEDSSKETNNVQYQKRKSSCLMRARFFCCNFSFSGGKTMPQTKFQDIVFTILMVLIFVYVMTFYNAGLERDITLSTFGYALTICGPRSSALSSPNAISLPPL